MKKPTILNEDPSSLPPSMAASLVEFYLEPKTIFCIVSLSLWSLNLVVEPGSCCCLLWNPDPGPRPRSSWVKPQPRRGLPPQLRQKATPGCASWAQGFGGNWFSAVASDSEVFTFLTDWSKFFQQLNQPARKITETPAESLQASRIHLAHSLSRTEQLSSFLYYLGLKRNLPCIVENFCVKMQDY